MGKTYKIRGGKAIAAGGFGCIFKPALKCKGSRKKYNGVSKLMFNKLAKNEMEEIEQIKPIIQTIPNYNNYFIINNITSCKPAKLSSSDLVNYNTCSNFLKYDLTKNMINTNIDNVSIINIPNGGIDILKWLTNNDTPTKSKLNIHNLQKLNLSLIDILKNAIIPMNKRRLFHLDIKSENILVDKNYNLKIIDWGLSAIQKNNDVPDRVKYARVFQYNLPLSNILFNSLLQTSINKYKSHKSSEKFQKIAVDYSKLIIMENGNGHIDTIKYIIRNIYQHQNSSRTAISVNNVIKNYLAQILQTFTDKNVFNIKAYFNNVYSHNADIWGFLTIYSYISIFMQSSKIKNKQAITKQISDIVIKYCYSTLYSDKPIPINNLIADLNKITALLSARSISKYRRSIKNKQTSRRKTSRNTKRI